MTGPASWMTLVILVLAISPVIAFWISGRVARRSYRDEEGTVRCRPHGNKLVQCTVVRDAKTGEPIGVKACSEFGSPEDVRCARACLALFKEKAA